MVREFHSHSLFSDGVLGPSELARRYEAAGYKSLAITDHADSATLDFILPRIVAFAKNWNTSSGSLYLIPGIELTHVQPHQIAQLAKKSRELGAQVIIVHGQTLVEPVASGTNSAALKADIDILAHPGLLTLAQARLAKQRNIMLEISARSGHCLANGHVAALAAKMGAPLIYGTDFHAPENLLSEESVISVLAGAGLSHAQIRKVFDNMNNLEKKIRKTLDN